MKATCAANALDPRELGPNFPFINTYPIIALYLKWLKSIVFQTEY